MPTYIYIDEAGHTRELEVRMLYSTAVVCECGRVMHRKPQAARINWNGPRPSSGELSPVIRRHIDQTPIRMDRYLEKQAMSPAPPMEDIQKTARGRSQS